MSQESSNSKAAAAAETEVRDPPSTLGGLLRSLGPGLIIASSIVGSGELIATTKTGAEAGFVLLWLILVGCVIKVFAQIEFGRYSINTGQTTLSGLNQFPGPRLRAGWLVWCWAAMFVVGIAQLGGIVGGVGQALSLSVPITGDFQELVKQQQSWDKKAEALRTQGKTDADEIAAILASPRPSQQIERTRDDIYWSAIVTLLTAALLASGRYGIVQSICTVLVVCFTLITIGNLVALQTYGDWAVTWQDLRQGLRFGLPVPRPGTSDLPIATALAAFGIIGVGATELVYYPYWCLEKGYARFTGPRSAADDWAKRARGWLRAMRFDAFLSMVVYTFCTLAFYLLGAAILHQSGSNPAKDQLVPTLAEMYAPVFGQHAQYLFLFGAFAVLFSTFFAASASNARVLADAVRIYRLGASTEAARQLWVRVFCVILPCISLAIYWVEPSPVKLILAAGVAQALMLPLLGAAALFLRYRRGDPRTAPGRVWDICLWLSAGGFLVAGAWNLWSNVIKAFG